MNRTSLLAAAVACLVAVPAAASAQSDISGAWEVSMTTAQGVNTVDANLTQMGESVEGELSSPLGKAGLKGKLVMDALALSAAIDFQGNTMTLVFDGKVEGDTMTGIVKIGDFGEAPWTAKRKPAPAPFAPAETTAGADISGAWDVKMNVLGNEIPLTAVFKQEGSSVTGTMTGPQGDVAVSGTMTGTTLRLAFDAVTQQGTMNITMTGDLGGNGFTGTMALGPAGEANWTATRAQ